MKFNIKEVNLPAFRHLVLPSDEEQISPLHNEDIDSLFDSVSTLTFNVSYGDNLKEALLNMDPNEIDREKAKKAVFVIRCRQSYELLMEEFADLNRYICDFMPDADFHWAVASRGVPEKNITLIAFTTY